MLTKVNRTIRLFCDDCSTEIECCEGCGLPFIADEKLICEDGEHHCTGCRDAICVTSESGGKDE